MILIFFSKIFTFLDQIDLYKTSPNDKIENFNQLNKIGADCIRIKKNKNSLFELANLLKSGDYNLNEEKITFITKKILFKLYKNFNKLNNLLNEYKKELSIKYLRKINHTIDKIDKIYTENYKLMNWLNAILKEK